MNSNVVKMLKNSPVIPTFTNLIPQKCYGMVKAATKLEAIFGAKENWPQLLQEIVDKE